MPALFKRYDKVRVVQPVIEGRVDAVNILDGDLFYTVKWRDAAGVNHERTFKEQELENAP